MNLFSHPDEHQLLEQYQKLQQIGIALSDHYSVEDLVHAMKRHNQVTPLDLLEVMGGTFGRIPHFHLSDDVWALDSTGIEDPQAYSDLLTRLGALLRRDIKLENIRSDLRPLENKASLEFDYRGNHHEWSFDYRPEYFDPDFFRNFLHLIADLDSDRALAFTTKGPLTLIVYTTDANLAALRALTSKPWDWLAIDGRKLT